ncbi:putative RNA-directed DNA polymerase from transposon BS [Takifugu flavidus]|uniref:Putative RNA-directed DNA polymerase from transposon BS n=1 Tax=Takifugu flavidus TaxID=433684 RepID=A0A5C6NCK5_9TELE|nr:putative RNA-directed DNA polymerase from transposon BS [Takifugu flavidus]
MGVGGTAAAWTTDYLTNRLQYVRLCDCESNVVICSTGAPQGTVLSPFLFTLYTSDFSYNSDSCHLQKFSDDTAIVGRVSEGNELEYREVITNFVAWCELNHLCINTNKTKEVVIDFSRKASHTAPVNIQGLDIKIVGEYKYLGVHLNNKLDWTHNTDALYKKGQSHLHLLRRLRSFGDFYDSVVASVIFYAVVCWSCGSSERDRKRLNKLVRRAGSVLDCSLDSIDEDLGSTLDSVPTGDSIMLLGDWLAKQALAKTVMEDKNSGVGGVRVGRRQLAHTVLGVCWELLTSPGAIIRWWKEYFQELLNPTNTYPQGGTESGDPEVEHPISGAEVAEVVKQLPGGGAPGADEICPGYLKALDVVGLSWLTRLQHCVDIGGSGLGRADWGGGPYFQEWGPKGVF